jgi:hypothetical protein
MSVSYTPAVADAKRPTNWSNLSHQVLKVLSDEKKVKA